MSYLAYISYRLCKEIIEQTLYTMPKIKFEEIVPGLNGSEVASLVHDNFEKINQSLINIEEKVDYIEKNGIGMGVIGGSAVSPVLVTCNPNNIITTKMSIAQQITVDVAVRCGNQQLKAGNIDDSFSTYQVVLPNSNLDGIGTITTDMSNNKLKFKVVINANASKNTSFLFNIVFKGEKYTSVIPVTVFEQGQGGDPNGEVITAPSMFVSNVFKRSNLESLPAPTGGDYNNPVPSGWSDGIPAGNETLWASKRRFVSNAVGQDTAWSTPVVCADSADMDVCFSKEKSCPPQPPCCVGDQDTCLCSNGEKDPYWHNIADPDDWWMAMRTKSGGKWSDWNITRIKGEDGSNGNYKNTIYKESAKRSDVVNKPTLQNPKDFVGRTNEEVKAAVDAYNSQSNIDASSRLLYEDNYGWKDGPDASGGIWFMSSAFISGDDGTVVDNDDENGGWSTPICISPGEGVPGQAVFLSTVFKRGLSVTQPLATEGSFSNPTPTGWSDGIPPYDPDKTAEENKVWESHRKFTDDALSPQDADWSEPRLMEDNADFDCCYCYCSGVPEAPTVHGNQGDGTGEGVWHNNGVAEDKANGIKGDNWMATSSRLAGKTTWEPWVLTRIVGEDGTDGDYMNYIFKEFVGEELDAPTYLGPNPENVFIEESDNTVVFSKVKAYYPDMDSEDVAKNYGWKDGPGVSGTWWMSCVLIDGETNTPEAGNTWSKPVKIGGTELEVEYSVTDNAMDYESANSDKWKKELLEAIHTVDPTASTCPSGYYVWMRQRKSDETSLWSYMRVTGEKGEAGTSIKVSGSVSNMQELFALETDISDGTSYVLDGHMWVWSESATYKEETHKWVDCGQIQGPSGQSMYFHVKYATVLKKTNDKGLPYPDESDVTETVSKYIGTKVDTNPNDTTNDYDKWTWSKFSGDDGYGYEYVYKLTATKDAPAIPDSGTPSTNGKVYTDNDYIPEGWTDNASGVSVEMPYEWVIKRVRQGNDSGWGPWQGSSTAATTALLYAYRGEDAPSVIREWSEKAELVKPSPTDSNYDDFIDDSKWSRQTVNCREGFYIWERTCTLTPAHGDKEAVTSPWTYVRVTGEKGNDGTGLSINGEIESVDQLLAMTVDDSKVLENGVNNGTSYLVGGHIWTWSTSNIDENGKTPRVYYNAISSTDALYDYYNTTHFIRHWRDGGVIQGPSGKTMYMHVKYAERAVKSTKTVKLYDKYGNVRLDGNGQEMTGNVEGYWVENNSWLTTLATTNDGEAVGKFIGVYYDTTELDSNDLTRYSWSKFNGDDGVNFEYIYKRTNTYEAPHVPTESECVEFNGKNFQDKDYLPEGWTDNPTGPDSTMPYEWVAKRETFVNASGETKWQEFKGQSDDVRAAILWAKFGNSAVNIQCTQTSHTFTRNENGETSTEDVLIGFTADVDGLVIPITIDNNDIVRSDTAHTTTSVSSDTTNNITTVKLTVDSGLTDNGNIKIPITVDGKTYDRVFDYIVISEGKNGVAMGFEPSIITVTQSPTETGTTATLTDASTTFHLYHGGAEVDTSLYTISLVTKQDGCTETLDTALNDKVDYTFTNNQLSITGFKHTNQVGGKFVFEINYNQEKYYRTVRYSVSWLGTFRSSITDDVWTNASNKIDTKLSEEGIITATNFQSKFEESASAITSSVTGLTQQYNELGQAVGQITAQTSQWETKISGIEGKVQEFTTNYDPATIEENILTQAESYYDQQAASLQLGVQTMVRPNLLPNSLFNLRIKPIGEGTTKLRSVRLNAGVYIFSCKANVTISVKPYTFNVWDQANNVLAAITVNSTSASTSSVTFSVSSTSYVSVGYTTFTSTTEADCTLKWLKIEKLSDDYTQKDTYASVLPTAWCASDDDSSTNNILNVGPTDTTYPTISRLSATTITSGSTLFTRLQTRLNASSTFFCTWDQDNENKFMVNASLAKSSWKKPVYFWVVARPVNFATSVYFGAKPDIMRLSGTTVGSGTTNGLAYGLDIRKAPSVATETINLNDGWVLYYRGIHSDNYLFNYGDGEELSDNNTYNQSIGFYSMSSDKNEDNYIDILAAGISTEGIPSPNSISATLGLGNMKQGLKKSGIDIDLNQITLDSTSVQIKNGDQTAAMFVDGKIKADYIEAENLLTNALKANSIDAENAFIQNLTVEGTFNHVSTFVNDVKNNPFLIPLDNNSDEYYLDVLSCPNTIILVDSQNYVSKLHIPSMTIDIDSGEFSEGEYLTNYKSTDNTPRRITFDNMINLIGKKIRVVNPKGLQQFVSDPLLAIEKGQTQAHAYDLYPTSYIGASSYVYDITYDLTNCEYTRNVALGDTYSLSGIIPLITPATDNIATFLNYGYYYSSDENLLDDYLPNNTLKFSFSVPTNPLVMGTNGILTGCTNAFGSNSVPCSLTLAKYITTTSATASTGYSSLETFVTPKGTQLLKVSMSRNSYYENAGRLELRNIRLYLGKKGSTTLQEYSKYKLEDDYHTTWQIPLKEVSTNYLTEEFCWYIILDVYKWDSTIDNFAPSEANYALNCMVKDNVLAGEATTPLKNFNLRVRYM